MLCYFSLILPNKLFRTVPERDGTFFEKNCKLEGLPPTEGVLKPLIARANYASAVFQSYKNWINDQPSMISHGWVLASDGSVQPVLNLNPAAPEAVLKLIKYAIAVVPVLETVPARETKELHVVSCVVAVVGWRQRRGR